MNNMDLNAWLTLLENRHEQEIQLGLQRVAAVAEILQVNKPAFPVILVGGTNGKGSTIAALEAIYLTAGYRVATYTSPHLVNFNERIKLLGQPIADQSLCEALEQVEKARGDIPLTYFEQVTLAAFLIFKEAAPDVALIEVGLGGRLDATNILDADLAIITTVDYDHKNYLGDTLEEIGYEKSGILRANQLFIYADEFPPHSVSNKAEALPTQYYQFKKDYHYHLDDESIRISLGEIQHILPLPDLHPQALASAVVASELLQSRLPVKPEALVDAFASVSLPGRLQLLEYGGHPVLLDVAHNPQSAERLAGFLKHKFRERNIHFVFGSFKDKDLSGIIRPLKHISGQWYPVQLTGSRAWDKDLLLRRLSDLGIAAKTCYADPMSGVLAAVSQASSQVNLQDDLRDLIVVFGSFHTVGPVLKVLTEQDS